MNLLLYVLGSQRINQLMIGDSKRENLFVSDV
jgi:hypothetical protein